MSDLTALGIECLSDNGDVSRMNILFLNDLREDRHHLLQTVLRRSLSGTL